nr:hypothetical protein [Tanacetum cinerariifolium]
MDECNDTAASISVLPEGCISNILSLTSPRDASRAAAISKTFNTAADSDFVWDQFLPPDYRQLIARAVAPVDIISKKTLYMYLSHSHVLLDRGTLGLKLDKDSLPRWQYLERHGHNEEAPTQHAAPTTRNDGWMEIELGEFYHDDGNEGDVEMKFQEHRTWKTGLIVEGIELRPK